MQGGDSKQEAMFSYVSPERLLRVLLLQIFYSARREPGPLWAEAEFRIALSPRG